MYYTVTTRTRLCVPIYSICKNVKLQNDVTKSVTLTFKEGTWFLDPTHRLDVVDICAKQFQNCLMYGKVTVRTRMEWGCTDGQTDGRTDGRCDFNTPPFGDIKSLISQWAWIHSAYCTLVTTQDIPQNVHLSKRYFQLFQKKLRGVQCYYIFWSFWIIDANIFKWRHGRMVNASD
jgi:hypothetical protein